MATYTGVSNFQKTVRFLAHAVGLYITRSKQGAGNFIITLSFGISILTHAASYRYYGMTLMTLGDFLLAFHFHRLGHLRVNSVGSNEVRSILSATESSPANLVLHPSVIIHIVVRELTPCGALNGRSAKHRPFSI